ncbi:diacylglycerol kinase family protein [Salinisphaera sp. LB1]|uniref:diacylglycerol kinase family protein n=1 Tax=Salinisphaera sp. LB1 TaxID=2183911 RepID=UPI000D7085B1|nr:diacylglycerol kinase family protein [Salinisphaera sp. LB1]AWN16729.1 Diacylglycerol kinase [Salinisphaera sp. LB1]
MNDSTAPFTFIGRIRSMRYAIAGIGELLVSQHNAWVHAAATAVVVCLGLIVGVTPIEWCVLILAITTVWVAEALNTAFELLCDVASPDFHPVVKKAKDVAAGAVLLSALGSVAIGLIVFLPYLARWL